MSALWRSSLLHRDRYFTGVTRGADGYSLPLLLNIPQGLHTHGLTVLMALHTAFLPTISGLIYSRPYSTYGLTHCLTSYNKRYTALYTHGRTHCLSSQRALHGLTHASTALTAGHTASSHNRRYTALHTLLQTHCLSPQQA